MPHCVYECVLWHTSSGMEEMIIVPQISRTISNFSFSIFPIKIINKSYSVITSIVNFQLVSYYSYTHTYIYIILSNIGSWFIQALCHVLQRQGRHRDLLSCLTRVSRKVAFDFQSNTPGDYVMHEKKQIPCITSMLTRDIIFVPK